MDRSTGDLRAAALLHPVQFRAATVHEESGLVVVHLDDVGDVQCLVEKARDGGARNADISVAGAAKMRGLDERVAAWCHAIAGIAIAPDGHMADAWG